MLGERVRSQSVGSPGRFGNCQIVTWLCWVSAFGHKVLVRLDGLAIVRL